MDSTIRTIRTLQQTRVYLRGMIRSLEIELRGREREMEDYSFRLRNTERELEEIRKALPDPEEFEYDGEPASKRRRVG